MYTCTHIESGTNGTSDTNQLNMARLELSMRLITLGSVREGCAQTITMRAVFSDVFGVDALLLVGGVCRGRVIDVASHLDHDN